jgi:hypothetical protein
VCWLLSNFFLTIPTGYHGKEQKIKFTSVFFKNGPMLDAMGIPLFEIPSRTVGKKKYVMCFPITLKK